MKGLHKSVEEVKERNGPFAGKRVARPVANYEACHSVVVSILLRVVISMILWQVTFDIYFSAGHFLAFSVSTEF